MFTHFRENTILFFTAVRAYSTAISVMSWSIPFLFAALSGGNIFYGILALFGIVVLHYATNIFDDAIDYTKEIIDVKRGVKTEINLQKGKCAYIINKKMLLKTCYLIAGILFLIGLLIGLFFLYNCAKELLYIIIPTGILCLIYPFAGSLGLGEIIVGIIFSPMLYSGVYFVMKGEFSPEIFIISISTGLLTISVLHNHMLLDYKYDGENGKTTLCRICGNERNSFYLLILIISLAYLNLIFFTLLKKLSYYYLIPLLSIPQFIMLYKTVKKYMEDKNSEIKYNILMGNMTPVHKATDEEKNFLTMFLIVQNLLTTFTILLWISIIADKLIKCT